MIIIATKKTTVTFLLFALVFVFSMASGQPASSKKAPSASSSKTPSTSPSTVVIETDRPSSTPSSTFSKGGAGGKGGKGGKLTKKTRSSDYGKASKLASKSPSYGKGASHTPVLAAPH